MYGRLQALASIFCRHNLLLLLLYLLLLLAYYLSFLLTSKTAPTVEEIKARSISFKELNDDYVNGVIIKYEKATASIIDSASNFKIFLLVNNKKVECKLLDGNFSEIKNQTISENMDTDNLPVASEEEVKNVVENMKKEIEKSEANLYRRCRKSN